jgi:peptide-methionine (S)-S-oxide reductase
MLKLVFVTTHIIAMTLPTVECLTAQTMASTNAKNIKTFHFGAGCFWAPADKIKSRAGILSTSVGYCGDDNIQFTPTYESVCSGKSKLVETVRVEYDSSQLTFEDLLQMFSEVNTSKRGNKRQYEGIVFVSSDEEAEIANAFLRDRKDVVATVEPMSATFYKAEPYHQDYWSKLRIRISILVITLAFVGKYGGDMSQITYNILCYSFIGFTLLERKFDAKVDKIILKKNVK